MRRRLTPSATSPTIIPVCDQFTGEAIDEIVNQEDGVFFKAVGQNFPWTSVGVLFAQIARESNGSLKNNRLTFVVDENGFPKIGPLVLKWTPLLDADGETPIGGYWEGGGSGQSTQVVGGLVNHSHASISDGGYAVAVLADTP